MAKVRLHFKSGQGSSDCTNPNFTLTSSYETTNFTLNGETLATNRYYQGDSTLAKIQSIYRLFVSSGHGYTIAKAKVYFTRDKNTALVDVTSSGIFSFYSTVIDINLGVITANWGSGFSDLNLLVFDFKYEPPAIPKTITETLIGCTSNNTQSSVLEGTSKTIIYSPIAGKKIVGITHNNPLNALVEINAARTQGTFSFIADKDVSITATNLLNAKVIRTGSFTNCTCNYANNEKIDVAKNLTITANAGFEFRQQFEYKKGLVTYGFVINSKVLEIGFSTFDEFSEDITLPDAYKAIREVERIGNFVNLYKVSKDELTSLSNVRFAVGQNAQDIVDYGQFITNLYVLPFSIPDYVIGDRTNIILGRFDSNVESTSLLSYTFEFDCGGVSIPLKYNNMYDFLNTDCFVYLPFVGKVLLPTEQVIGQAIGVKYAVDLYSGNVMLRVSSSFNAYTTIYTANMLVGQQIPFLQNQTNSIIGSISNIYDNLLSRFYVEITRNIPYQKDVNVFGSATVEYGILSSYSGYLQCDDVVLSTDATKKEQDEIKSLLKSGVFI